MESKYLPQSEHIPIAELARRINRLQDRPGKNLLIGAKFDLNPFQRGSASTAITTSGSFVADRWRVEFDGTVSIQRELVDVPLGTRLLGVNCRKALKLTLNSKSGNTYIRLGQRIESADTCAGGNVAFSCGIQGNKSMTIPLRAVQFFGTGGSPSSPVVTPGLASLAVTSSLQELFSGFSLPSVNGKSLGTTEQTDYLELQCDLSGMVAADYVIIPIGKAEGGGVSTYYRYEDKGDVLKSCQRFYEKTYNVEVAPGSLQYAGSLTGISSGAAAGACSINWIFKVPKRVPPTVTLYNVNTGATGSIHRADGAAIAAGPLEIGHSSVRIYNSVSTLDQYGHYMHGVADAEFAG